MNDIDVGMLSQAQTKALPAIRDAVSYIESLKETLVGQDIDQETKNEIGRHLSIARTEAENAQLRLAEAIEQIGDVTRW